MLIIPFSLSLVVLYAQFLVHCLPITYRIFLHATLPMLFHLSYLPVILHVVWCSLPLVQVTRDICRRMIFCDFFACLASIGCRLQCLDPYRWPRRWLERHNAKLREAGKKEEKKRLKQFVEDAYRRDPRVTARREFEKSER